ncbi:hypothetical protein C922_01663 [Plasmodium inui San Antonio 1]|uniref:Uncharacterized protein n=1 Tax=Plasmodium inui San Antonio 1 TaxID=1237626 RepID=W7ARI5_9APIC|nr:hypothetical protein C922_01663 [Plasmodium inui San Antonio 1]EUD68051.1 hypothetical protein C922_01663 [Plasmodium inui San Antonio 1]
MISIQTCQSSNRVDLLLRGKFVKGNKRDFLLAAKDSYLELLTGDFKETIFVQNTFLKIIHLQIQEGKDQDHFLVADEKLNFRILKFDGSFVETCFLGNFRSSKLKKYVQYSTVRSGKKKDEFFHQYSRHIHVCKLKEAFIVSIENVVFFVIMNEYNWIHKKLSDYCRNYDFRVKSISKENNVNIIYDPMQLRHYIIHRNRSGRKRIKYISSSFSRDCKAHVYRICMNCPEPGVYRGSSKGSSLRTGHTPGVPPTDEGQRRKHPLAGRNKFSIKVKKIPIEKYPKEEPSCIRFRKNVSFVTLLEYTTEGYSNVQSGPSYTDQRSVRSLSTTRCNTLLGEWGAFVRNAPNGGLFGNPRKQIEVRKSSHVTSPSQGSTSYGGYESKEAGVTSPVRSGTASPTHHTVHFHDQEQPCSKLRIRRQHSTEEKSRKKNYYNEFSNCTSLKICFIVNFIRSGSSHTDFVRHVLFLCDKEEIQMMKVMRHLRRTNIFETNDWDVLNKYGKELPGDEALMSHNNYLLDPSPKWKQLYEHRRNSKGGETGRHTFGACPLCQYHFDKINLLQGDPIFEQIFERNFFCRNHGVCDGKEGTRDSSDSINPDDARRVTTLLLGLSIRLKLLLLYFSHFFYSSSRTLRNSSCAILLRRQNGRRSIIRELAMHIYLLNLFVAHIFQYVGGDSGGDSSADPTVGRLAAGKMEIERLVERKLTTAKLMNAHAQRDKYDVTHLEEKPNGGCENGPSGCTPNGDRLPNEMFLSMCQKLNLLIGEYMTDSTQGSRAGMEESLGTFCSDRLETTEGEITDAISTHHCQVVQRLIIDIQNLRLISLTCLKEFNFNYEKVRDKLLRRKEKLDRRSSGRMKKRKKNDGHHPHRGRTHQHRIDHKRHIILITTNHNGQANIIFFKNRTKKKNTTVNNIIIPIGKLYLPIEVQKVESVMNRSSFVLFAKRGIVFFFHFSTAYGANLTLVNYHFALHSDVFFVEKLRFFRIVKRDGTYEEIEHHILCSDYFVKCVSLKSMRNFPQCLWPSVRVGGWHAGKHMGRERRRDGKKEAERDRDRHLGRSPLLQPRTKWSEQTEESLLPRGNNYINSATEFHALRRVPFIDSFYTYAFVYHYDFKFFQEVCVSGWGSTSAGSNNCICADMDIGITTVGGGSTVGRSSMYGRSGSVSGPLPRGKTQPQVQLQPPRDVSSSIGHPTPVSLQISKSAFNEIYKRRKYAFFTDPQGDDPNEGGTTRRGEATNSGAETSSGAATSSGGTTQQRRGVPPKKRPKKSTKRRRKSRCYLNNENDADSMGKATWEEETPSSREDKNPFGSASPGEDDALSNELIVSLGRNYPRKTHPVGNPFVKRYLSVDLRGKKMCVIILLFDMVASQMFIERTNLGSASPSTERQQSNYFRNLIASSKGMYCISCMHSTPASVSKPSATVEESTSFVLSLSEEQSDQLFMIKSCIYKASSGKQVKYIFNNVKKAYYTYERAKTVKDYKYKEKAVVTDLRSMESPSSITDELKKIANLYKGTAQVRGNNPKLLRYMEEEDHILSVKRLKKKMSDELIILDKNRDLHKVTLGHKVLLERRTNEATAPPENHSIGPPTNHTISHTFMIRFNDQLSILCMTRYWKTSYLYVRSKEDLFGDFQNALSLLRGEKKASMIGQNIFTISGGVPANGSLRGKNSPTKRWNQQKDIKKKRTFEMIQEEQLESLNLTKEKLIYAKCVGQNGRSNFYVLQISTNSIIINHYYVDPLRGTRLQLVDTSSWGLTSAPVIHYHFDKGILALSYVTGTVELFYIDGVKSLCLLIDRVTFEERIHSICIIPKEHKKGVPSNDPAKKYKYILLCIGLQRRCRVLTYYVDEGCMRNSTEASPRLLSWMDGLPTHEKEKENRNINLCGHFLNARNVKMDPPRGKDLRPFPQQHTFQRINKSLNPPEKNTHFVADVYEYSIDTLNDHCTITGMIKLNNFLLIGTNEGVVKVYDIFQSSNAPRSDLFLCHFRVYKNQKRVIKMFDEFLLGNNSVYFLNPLKGYDGGGAKSPRLVYQKRFRAVAFCGSGMFMFVSNRVIRGGTTTARKLTEGEKKWENVSGSGQRGSLRRGRHDYLDEMKARVNGYLGNLLNLEKYRLCDLLRDRRIGEGGMPSRNIFILPLRIFKNGTNPPSGGVNRSDATNQSSHLMEAHQTDSPPSDARNSRSDEPSSDRRKEAIPSRLMSGQNRETGAKKTDHFDYAPINQRLIKLKYEISANNIVLIKNKDSTFPYLIIIHLNHRLYTGLIQRDQILVEKRKNRKEGGTIDKFVKSDRCCPPCDYYTKNFVLYSEVSRRRRQKGLTAVGGGSNLRGELRKRHCYGDAKKQDRLSARCAKWEKSAKCAKTDKPNESNGFPPQNRDKERGIGTHCGGNNLCLKMDKKIIDTFRSSMLSDVFLISLHRKYILTELFLICSSTEKGEIIDAIEGGGDTKQEGGYSSGENSAQPFSGKNSGQPFSGQNSEYHSSGHLERPPLGLPPRCFPVKLLTNGIDFEGNTNESANSLRIYTQLYLRDYNLFASNKDVLSLLRNQCVNFVNRFYAFLFYNTVSRTHQLKPFFQDRWIAKNISITLSGSSHLTLGDQTVKSAPRGRDNYHLKDEEKKRELLHNCVNRICNILMALIGKKTHAVISKSLFLHRSHKKCRGEEAKRSYYEGETGDTHEGDSRDIHTGDAKFNGTKKKKGSGEHYKCTKKQRKVGNNETVQMDRKGGPVDPSKCIDDGDASGSPLADSPLKQMDVTPDPATNLPEELNPEEGSNGRCSQNRNVVTKVLFESFFNEVENIYKLRLLGGVPSRGSEADNVGASTSANEDHCHLTFLAVHLKGSKYHFSSVTEYYKIVGKKSAKGRRGPLETDAPEEENSRERDHRPVGEAGVADESIRGGVPIRVDESIGAGVPIGVGESGGGASPRSGTHRCRNKTHKKEHTQVRRRGIHKRTHHNRRTGQRKGKLPVLASRRTASYLLRENRVWFVLYRGWLRMASNSVKRFSQRVKTRKKKNETKESLKEEEKDSYDCLFVFPKYLRDQYKEILLCRLKDKVNRMFNFNEGDLFLVLKIHLNYVFLVNYRRRISFWVNIKRVYRNLLVIRLEQRPDKEGETKEAASNDRTSNDAIFHEGAPPYVRKDKTVLVFKKTKREDILPFFIKNTTTTPITYMSRGMRNIKPFQSKYIIFTQKNHIVLLKIVFSKRSREISGSKNGLMETILQNCIYDRQMLLYRTQDGRIVNFSDVFNELLGKQYVIKNRSRGKRGLSEVEYIEMLANRRGRVEGAATTTTNTTMNTMNSRGNNPERSANPDGSAQSTPSAANARHGEYLNGKQYHMMKQKDEQYIDLFKSYTFEEHFTEAEKEFLYHLNYQIVEHHRNEENFENINDMEVYEDKILIVTRSYVRLYQYDEEKNVLTLQCSNTFYNINSMIVNEKYRKALLLRGIFQSVNIASKRFLSVYYILGKCMYYIGHIKIRNRIKHIFENKLLHNVMGVNMNVNRSEHMIDSIRTYQRFFFNFFLIDSRGNFLSIYSSPFAEENQTQNYFYDHNRPLQICHDLMLFLQILINGKNGSPSPHPRGDPFMNKTKSLHSKKRMKKLQRNYFYNNYFIKSKYRTLLTIFISRFFIYMNKKILFLENAFSQRCTDDFLFELKLRVYNRILKLSSYDFSDRKSAFQLLNDMYDMRANKNVPYFSLQTRLQDYADIIRSDLYHMKVFRSDAPRANQPVEGYLRPAAINHAKEPSLERSITRKIEEMNKYRFDPIRAYNGVVKNNIRDNCYYDVDFYHFLDCIHNMDQGTFSKKTKPAEYKKYLKNSFADNSLFQIYFNFLTYMSNNPKMFHHMKKYLHFHPYSTKLLKNRTYYFNMDLLNVIFSFDNDALAELRSVITLFPTCPSLDEVFTAVSLMHMPLGGA